MVRESKNLCNYFIFENSDGSIGYSPLGQAYMSISTNYITLTFYNGCEIFIYPDSNTYDESGQAINLFKIKPATKDEMIDFIFNKKKLIG